LQSGHWQWLVLCGLTGRSRPIFAGHDSPNRPVSQIQILRTGRLQSSHWGAHPIGHNLPIKERK